MLLGAVSRLVQSKSVHPRCIIEGKSHRKHLVMSFFIKEDIHTNKSVPYYQTV